MKRHGYFMAAVLPLLIPLNVAAHGGNTNLVHACVKNSTLAVRIVAANASCTSGETAKHWNITGVKGATGLTGPQGPAGATGPAGTNGIDGADGAPGAAGPQGPAGLVGSAGPQGVPGTDGSNGAPGVVGPQGPAGAQGAAGDSGATGPQGPIGDTGPAGTSGQDGLIGATGPKGDTGDQGVAGETGPQGPKGDVGPRGFDGPPATETTPIIWSGGCSHSGYDAGLNRYCTDTEEFNTADGYLVANANGDLVVETAGFYRVNFWTVSGGNGYASVILRKNDNTFHYGYSSPGDSNLGGAPTIGDVSADVTYPFSAGDVITVDVDSLYLNIGQYNNYAYHAFSPIGRHSRLQIQYIGPLQ